jgi:hypothetical protein
MISIHSHSQIYTTVMCACGRAWGANGLICSPFVFRERLRKNRWSVADGGNELYIGEDGIQCPVCTGRMTEEEYKSSGL